MDAEWLAMMLEAKEIGLTPEDVRKWIDENNRKRKQPSDEALRRIYELIKRTSYPRSIKRQNDVQ